MADRYVARAEMRLARADVHSLRELPLRPDPLEAFARAFAQLDSRYGDAATVAIDLLPVPPAAAARVRERWRRDPGHERPKRSRSGVLDDVLRALGVAGARGGPADTLDHRQSVSAAVRKLSPDEAIFELQILVRCTSGLQGRQIRHLQTFLSCFRQWSERNHFRVAGVSPRLGVAFLGSDLPLIRAWFDHRIDTGRFAPRGQSRRVVSREIVGLLKPPTVHCAERNVIRAGAIVARAPADLPRYRRQPHVMPLGRTLTDGGLQRVGMDLGEFHFGYLSGKSRYGKTELGLVQAVHLGAIAKQGVFFLDPHTDAKNRVKPYLYAERARLIELDLSQHALDARHTCWNLFAMHYPDCAPIGEDRIAVRADAIVDAFAVASSWGKTATRALAIISQVATTLLHLAHRLPPELAPTVWTILRLLEDPEWREDVIAGLPDEICRYWQDRFPELPEDARVPLVNVLTRLQRAPTLRATLGSPQSTYNARRSMDESLIVLACPGGGREKLVANFLLQDRIAALTSRRELGRDERPNDNWFLDEAQTYDRETSGSIPETLEQCAKYGARVQVMNQSPQRLSEGTLDAISTNASALVTTANSYQAATFFGRQWAGVLDAKTIVPRLARYTYIAQPAHGGHKTEPFLLYGEPLEDMFGDLAPPRGRLAHAMREIDAEIDERCRPRTVRETLELIGGHDDRIRAARATRRRRADRGAAGDAPLERGGRVVPGGITLEDTP